MNTFKNIIPIILTFFVSCTNDICQNEILIYRQGLQNLVNDNYFQNSFPLPFSQNKENKNVDIDSMKFIVFLNDTIDTIKDSLILDEIIQIYGYNGFHRNNICDDNLIDSLILTKVPNFKLLNLNDFESALIHNETLLFIRLSSIYFDNAKEQAFFTLDIVSNTKIYMKYLFYITKNKNEWILYKKELLEIS
jgi:hypothetical protein